MNIKIQKNVLLAPQTTFKIGGEAKFFIEVFNDDNIIEAVQYAKDNNLKIFILGGGSNVLISDGGFDGLVIKIKNNGIKINDCEIECDAGVSLINLVNFSVKNGLAGLEWAAGIPGTVGGAIRGNAGAFGGEMKDSLVEIKFLNIKKDPLEMEFCSNEQCKFDYRSSIIKNNTDLILVSAKFKLKKGIAYESEKVVKETINKRLEKQPTNPSAGSFFKNPRIDKQEIIEKFESDMGMKMRGGQLPAGWFIDDLGFKGKKIGGAQVSEKHANFIINAGDATAEDIIILSSFLKQKVRDTYGIQLEEEVSRIGF
ncbi:MAG: UDP-N-acetylenolpyruvoylglucosamine reductase [Candidatus Moranbacteria bacterium GW2011_GWF1_34_10]|nr:MAG: UDP-N-acetylenolpyruvoylglucosamine reductase [Candidatus Moranbacteria bacterium GW2011_GWF1_34_10]